MIKKNASKTRMVQAFGLSPIIFIGILAAYWYISNSQIASFTKLMSSEVNALAYAKEAKSLLLECRQHEKDFILHKEIMYIERMKEDIAKLKEANNKIVAIASKEQSTHNSNILKLEAPIHLAIENYEKAFLTVVKDIEKKGFDHNSGLQGEFRQTIHELAAALQRNHLAELNIAHLQIRRYEKGYLRTESKFYFHKHKNSIKDYEILLETMGLEATINRALKLANENYKTSFEEFIGAADQKTKNEAYNKVRTFAHQTEDAIDSSFVPFSKELLLLIRKEEKD